MFEAGARAYCSRALLVDVQAINIIRYVKVYNYPIVKPGGRTWVVKELSLFI